MDDYVPNCGQHCSPLYEQEHATSFLSELANASGCAESLHGYRELCRLCVHRIVERAIVQRKVQIEAVIVTLHRFQVAEHQIY